MMIDAKLCAHFADVCLRAAEQEDDPNYRAMLLELAKEWLIDAERELTPRRSDHAQNVNR